MLEPVLQKETPEAATLPGIDYRFVDRSYVMSGPHQKAQAWTMFLQSFWTVKVSTTQEELLNTEDEQVQQIIFQIRSSPYIPNNVRLANRLSSLFNAAKEEDPDSPGIPIDSIRTFYYFLEKHSNLKYPIITLTPDNDIYASWKGGQNQVFSVHFVSNEDVRFVIFKPNKNHTERKIIFYGTDTADTLMETVTFSGIWDWISDER